MVFKKLQGCQWHTPKIKQRFEQMGQTAGRQKTEDQEYFELICKFPLRPIRSKSELARKR
jgi:hypothetical protein